MSQETFRELRKWPPHAPPLFYVDPNDLLADARQAIDCLRETEDRIVAEIKPEDAKYENVVEPLMIEENAMTGIINIVNFLKEVSADEALRDASRKAEKFFNDYFVESVTREDVFRLVDSVAKQSKNIHLEPECHRCLEKLHREYIMGGLSIADIPKRDRFKEIQKQLSDLKLECKKNFASESGGLWLTLEELDGVPQDTLDSLRKGAGENSGKLWLTFKNPDFQPCMKYAKNPLTRKRVYIAFENKCNMNAPLLRSIFILRDEAARLLGYPDHATLRLEEKMAKTPQYAMEFLEDLRSKLPEAAAKSKAEELEAKSEDLKSLGLEQFNDGKLYLWDTAYYGRLVLEKKHSLDQNEVAQYLPLECLLPNMMGIFEHLFGLKFVDLTAETAAHSWKGRKGIWHEDVKAWGTWSREDGEQETFLGWLYLDLHPRDNKYTHACHINLHPGFQLLRGFRRAVASALICNFTKPLPNKPSLLKHSECVTLFHELGHAIHSLVSKTRYARFHGTRTSRDFVEIPSKMLENWFWTTTQLKNASHHYAHLAPTYMEDWLRTEKEKSPSSEVQEPPLKMPDAMICSIVDSRFERSSLSMLGQIFLSVFDMTVHTPSSHEEIEQTDFQVLFNRMRHQMTGIDVPSEDYRASAISADIFTTAFEADPMSAETGRRYLQAILEKGGSRPEMELLESFLGRRPRNDALIKRMGLMADNA